MNTSLNGVSRKMPRRPSAGAHRKRVRSQVVFGEVLVAVATTGLEDADLVALLGEAQRRHAAAEAGADDQPVVVEILGGIRHAVPLPRRGDAHCHAIRRVRVCQCPGGNTFFQSLFMLMTVQPRCFASSYSDWLKVPTWLSGRPCAGP